MRSAAGGVDNFDVCGQIGFARSQLSEIQVLLLPDAPLEDELLLELLLLGLLLLELLVFELLVLGVLEGLGALAGVEVFVPLSDPPPVPELLSDPEAALVLSLLPSDFDPPFWVARAGPDRESVRYQPLPLNTTPTEP